MRRQQKHYGRIEGRWGWKTFEEKCWKILHMIVVWPSHSVSGRSISCYLISRRFNEEREKQTKRTETDENDFLGVEHSRTKFSLKSNEFAWHSELNFCRKIHNAFDIVDVISWPWTIIAHCPVAQVNRLFIYGRCWSGYSYQMVSIKPIMWLAHKEGERMYGAGGCSVLTSLQCTCLPFIDCQFPVRIQLLAVCIR